MTALNINIQDFIDMLQGLQQEGVKFVNMNLIPDENNPSANKLIIHPLYPTNPRHYKKGLEIKNKDVSTDNNDIFDLFNDIV